MLRRGLGYGGAEQLPGKIIGRLQVANEIATDPSRSKKEQEDGNGYVGYIRREKEAVTPKRACERYSVWLE
jgi:hypothetical protein